MPLQNLVLDCAGRVTAVLLRCVVLCILTEFHLATRPNAGRCRRADLSRGGSPRLRREFAKFQPALQADLTDSARGGRSKGDETRPVNDLLASMLKAKSALLVTRELDIVEERVVYLRVRRILDRKSDFGRSIYRSLVQRKPQCDLPFPEP